MACRTAARTGATGFTRTASRARSGSASGLESRDDGEDDRERDLRRPAYPRAQRTASAPLRLPAADAVPRSRRNRSGMAAHRALANWPPRTAVVFPARLPRAREHAAEEGGPGSGAGAHRTPASRARAVAHAGALVRI